MPSNEYHQTVIRESERRIREKSATLDGKTVTVPAASMGIFLGALGYVRENLIKHGVPTDSAALTLIDEHFVIARDCVAEQLSPEDAATF